ncbi:ComEA family DNA-binding protein [Paenibacillus tritici]|uniref:ComEA family DNA-binding protein n=1 Tax=Paenibacillus tritici TaxID=1873425 RepID=UPI001FE9ECD1|nr:ComEA family DNA-binding protein [Paenibacillus tritici]
MDKRMIICAITAALLGGSLVWAADHRGEDGIAGWKTLNAGMAQALGVAAEGEAGSAAAGVDGGSEAGGKVAGGGKESGVTVGGGKESSLTAGSGAANARATGIVAAGSGTAGAAGGGTGSGTVTAGNGVSGGGAGSAGGQAAGGEAASAGATGKDAVGSGTAGVAGAVADGRININTADLKLLMDLPGIGEKKAQVIIDYRSSKGAFRSLSDLGKVKGIGPKLLEKLKPLVAF